MKFVILSDIHLWWLEATLCYKGVLRKINVNAKQLLDKFMVDVNTVIKPEFVVVLGDLIEHENEEKDLKHLAYIYDKLQELHCPVHYVAGNHDLIYLSEEQLEKALHLESLYYSFDTEKYHNIILFSQAVKGVSSISEEQTQRLQYELKKTDKKCLIFLHHWLADQDLTGNPRFEGRESICLLTNRAEIREIISKSGKVVAVFNGHLHWNHFDMHDGIPYYTIQSLTENEEDKGIVSEAYAVVNISGTTSQVEIKGNYPKTFNSEWFAG